MLSLRSLRGRIVVSTFALALVVASIFVALVLTAAAQRRAERVVARSHTVATIATRLERYVLDLETGQRAYVITGDRRFLEPWEEARRLYPAEARRLRALVVDPLQRRRVETIHAAIDSYVRDWAQRVVDEVPLDQSRARELVASGQGKRRVDELRRHFDAFLDRQQRLTEQRTAAAGRTERRAVALGLAGLGGSAALIVLFAVYLLRAAVAPVEAVAGAARRLRAGEQTARAPERRGDDEVARLTQDFNAMATTLQESTAELSRRRAELEAVLDAAVDGISMVDPAGAIVFSNERIEQLWREVGDAHRERLWGRLLALGAAGAPAAEEEVVLDDRPRSFVLRSAPVLGPYGFAIGRVLTVRDTTAEREADRAKEEFVATVSHELRTPLTQIIGYLELVLDGEAGELSPEQQRFLAIVERSAHNLHAIVNDLLFVGQADAGRLQLERERVELGRLVARCAEDARGSAAEKRLALEIDADAAPVVDADPARLRQLVTNLIGNAVKFTPSGGSVRVRVDERGAAAVVEVEDTGIGIDPHEQDRLFERFFRASSATAEQVPGTGLGLAIAREIAEAHGGSIAVRSERGRGTTFTVELPLEVTS